MTTHELRDIEIAIDVPAPLGEGDRLGADGSTSYKFGDGLTDSMAVVVDVRPSPRVDPQTAASTFYETPVAKIEGATQVGERTIIEGAEFPTFEERASFENGLVLITRFVLLPGRPSPGRGRALARCKRVVQGRGRCDLGFTPVAGPRGGVGEGMNTPSAV